MELRILIFVVVCIASFFLAYKSGNKLRAILIPAGVAGVISLAPVLFDPKSFGFFGVIGLTVFVLLASLAYSVSAAVGCFAGLLMRSPSKTSQESSKRKWVAVSIMIFVALFASMQMVKENKFKSFSAVAEKSGLIFLSQRSEVLSITGPIIRSTIFAKGHNQNGFPLITYFVKGEQREAHVQIEVAGTEESPILSIRAVEPMPSPRKSK